MKIKKILTLPRNTLNVVSKNLLLTTIVLTFCVYSQAWAEADNQLWTAITTTGTFYSEEKPTKFRYYLEAQPRLGDSWQSWERLVLRGSLGYRVGEKLTLWSGYGYTPGLLNSKNDYQYTPESRLWEMATYDQQIGKYALNHRGIVEQRWIDSAQGTAHRARYRAKISRPLYTHENQITFGVTAFDEIMYNLNSVDNGPSSGYDRNRIFVGPYWTKNAWRVDAGYLYEASERPSKADREIHALALIISFNLN